MEIQYKSTIDVRLIQQMGGDHMVVAAAKVSTSGEAAQQFAVGALDEEKEKSNYGLINYLMKHRHGTPFEHSAMTFFVHAPVFVWREWHRHRIGFSYNEESGRYKQLEPTFYLPEFTRPMFKPPETWRPGRPKFLRITQIEDSALAEARFKLFIVNKKQQYESAYRSYQQALDDGFDPGLARIDLPVGIYSACWVTCNPRSLMAFLSLRTHEETAKFVSYPLWEIELAARACEAMLKDGWPLTYKAFIENGRVAP